MGNSLLKRLGFVSIEVVIAAALIMASGFIGISFLGTEGSAKMASAWEKVDELGVFGSSVVAERVELMSVTANGTPGYVETTELILTLNKDIDLTIDEVVLSGATLDALIDNDDGTYTLSISNITVADADNVAITLNKKGFSFGATNGAVVAVSNLELGKLTSITANGTPGYVETTELILTLNKDIDLTIDEVVLSGATLDALIDNDDGTYTLSISNITVADAANVTITLNKKGFSFGATNGAVVAVSNLELGKLTSITANGISGRETTTTLTISLDKDIDLVANDVRVTGATKGTLNDNNDGTYTLNIINITVANGSSVTVTLFKRGYSLTPDTKHILVNVNNYDAYGYNKSLAVNPLDINPSSEFTTAAVTGGVRITAYSGTDTSVVIPRMIGQLPVVEIGTNAFTSKSLTTLAIPNSVTIIGSHAFSRHQLVSLVIPSSVTTIGNSAFLNFTPDDSRLASVVIGNGVTTIGDSAFFGNRLTSIVFGNSVASIGHSAFFNNMLPSLAIPNSVTSIGVGAFEGNRLESISIPSSVTSIGARAFNNNQLPASQAFIYARTAGGIDDRTTLVSYGGAERGNVVIPSGVTTIGDHAFLANSLTSVTIPEGVVSIGDHTFANNLLTSITIPNGITSIPRGAFSNNPLVSISIPSSVTTIGSNAFSHHRLVSYTIPDTVTSIGVSAFMATTLTTLTIGSGLHTLDQSAFQQNPLTSVTFRGPVPTTLSWSIFSRSGMQTNTTLLAGSIRVPSAFLAAYRAVWSSFAIPSSDRFVGY